MLERIERELCHIIAVSKLAELLRQLADDNYLTPNGVDNLAVMRKNDQGRFEQIGYIDLAEENVNLESLDKGA